MMDERQRIVKRTFTPKQLRKMSMDDLISLVGEYGPNARLEGTGIVRKKDGTIRYDDDAKPGDFGESPEDLLKNGLDVTAEQDTS